VFRCVLGSEGCVLVPRSNGTPVAAWAWPIWVVSRRRVLEAVFILLEFSSPSRSIFIGSHSIPPSLVRRIDPSLIDIYYSSVAHPRCNDQVERANGMVLQALKDHIYDDASNYATRWLAELPHVIWGLRTQVSSATGFSPFFLVYGSEAILPTDVTFGAP
jgi:hypothetical protein